MSDAAVGVSCRVPGPALGAVAGSVRMPPMPSAADPDPCAGMFRRARVVLPSGEVTYTLVGPSGLPVAPVEEFCAYLRASAASPNTVRSYLPGLAAWWRLLAHTGHDWQDFPSSLFGDYLVLLRTGDMPGVARIGPARAWLAPASVQLASAAVLSFYRWQAAAHDRTAGYRRLYSRHVSRQASRYRPMLAGVGPRRESSERPVYPTRGPVLGTRCPVLTPTQVQAILDGCCTPAGAGAWSGSVARLRDRLLFATLAHTGMRLGEALSLRHQDVHVGAGETPFVEVVPRQDHPHGARVKSGRARRIYIGDDLEALYSAYVWELVDAGIDLVIPDLSGHFVFVNTNQAPLWSPLRPESVYDRVRSLSRAHEGLPDRWTPHWLRHTHASALLLAGCPPHVVMRRLGHADLHTTLEHYGWVTEDAELRAIADWSAYTAGWAGALHA